MSGKIANFVIKALVVIALALFGFFFFPPIIENSDKDRGEVEDGMQGEHEDVQA